MSDPDDEDPESNDENGEFDDSEFEHSFPVEDDLGDPDDADESIGLDSETDPAGPDGPEGSSDPFENGDGESGREGPLGDLAEEVERRRAEADDDVPMDELFEDSDVEGFDREALWRQVAGEDAAEQVVDDASATNAAATSPTVEDPAEVDESPPPPVPSPQPTEEEADRAERVVEKRSYCQGCEHFSTPPEVRCTHEGTEILEAVDMEHFRVVDCPIVAEDEELENV